MPVGRICNDCGEITTEPVGGRCAQCAPAHQARDARRRASKSQARVWNTRAWRRTRLAVWQRDSWTCQRCGLRDPGNRRRQLVANHNPPLVELLSAGLDPFDPAHVETLCLRHSGEEDGGRGRASY